MHRRGDSTPVEAGRELARLIPNARFVELPGADHAFWVGPYGSSAEEIEAFIGAGQVNRSVDRVLATLLFTDIIDSTRLASRLGDSEWRPLLERHNAIVKETVGRYDGCLVKTLGDGMLARFESPAAAVRCGIELTRSLGAAGLPTRAGVHTGECELIGEDVGGIAVHIGARVCAKASSGEILVSSTVAELVIGAGFDFSERGIHELKGVPGRWRLMAAEGENRPEQALHHETTLGPGDRLLTRLGVSFPSGVRTAIRMVGRRRWSAKSR
jgi:class 3 adenylate cyclase